MCLFMFNFFRFKMYRRLVLEEGEGVERVN